MTPAPDDPPLSDPLAAYIAGDPTAVRAAAPREPSEAEWEAARRRVAARLPGRAGRWRAAVALAAGVLLAVGAVAAWPARPAAPTGQGPRAVQPVPPVQFAAHTFDPLAEFDVLPIASAEEVVLHRVPGSGVLPVGAPLLPEALSLATIDDVEFHEPPEAWPRVLTGAGDAPLFFAKSR